MYTEEKIEEILKELFKAEDRLINMENEKGFCKAIYNSSIEIKTKIKKEKK